MILTKVIVNTTSDGSDLVANILISNGSNGATIVDKKDVVSFMADNPKLEYSETIITFYPTQALVVGVVQKENQEETLKQIKKDLSALQKNSPFNVGELSIRTEDVNDEHYVDIWMDFYKPYVVGKLKIYASWQKIAKSFFKVPIIVKPGPAFGTGQHPTTECCLELLQKIPVAGKSILDIGTGTGILAICALKLGAKVACLTDIDDVAIESSNENCEINGCLNKVTILKEDVVGNPSINADIVFLNISTEWALNYAENIKKNINKNGHLIVSGVYEYDKEKVFNHYKSCGYEIEKEMTKDGWVTFLARVK